MERSDLTRADCRPFAFAGLCEWWRAKDAPKDDKGLETFTILTTEPNELCAQDHNRMTAANVAHVTVIDGGAK
jgi:putative SOS response-associated peptidase YedK